MTKLFLNFLITRKE